MNWPQALILILNSVLLVWYSLHNNENRYDQQLNMWLAALMIGDHICPDNVLKDTMFSKSINLVTLPLKSYWWPTSYKYIHYIDVIYYCIWMNYINTSQNETSLTSSEEPLLDGTTGCINELRSGEAQQSQWPDCQGGPRDLLAQLSSSCNSSLQECSSHVMLE